MTDTLKELIDSVDKARDEMYESDKIAMDSSRIYWQKVDLWEKAKKDLSDVQKSKITHIENREI